MLPPVIGLANAPTVFLQVVNELAEVGSATVGFFAALVAFADVFAIDCPNHGIVLQGR